MGNTEKINKAIILDPFFEGSIDRKQEIDEILDLCNICELDILDVKSFFVRERSHTHLISKGILNDLEEYVSKFDSLDLIIFNCSLTSIQLKNLKKKFNIDIKDRIYVILDVFDKRASSSVAKLQINLARLKYESTTLVNSEHSLSQQKSGGGISRGLGEKKIEIDKRKIKEKIREIKRKIDEIESHFLISNKKRREGNIVTYSLVGYTNSGKSSLMKIISKEDVYIDPKVFATLDTTTRKIRLENGLIALITDTVGFIRNLPHVLIEAFKSTLQESVSSMFILIVVDASDLECEKKFLITMETLQSVNKSIDTNNCLIILNKIDLLTNDKAQEIYNIFYKYGMDICLTSAKDNFGIDSLKDKMIEKTHAMLSKIEIIIKPFNYNQIFKIISDFNAFQVESKYFDDKNHYVLMFYILNSRRDKLINMLSKNNVTEISII